MALLADRRGRTRHAGPVAAHKWDSRNRVGFRYFPLPHACMLIVIRHLTRGEILQKMVDLLLLVW